MKKNKSQITLEEMIDITIKIAEDQVSEDVAKMNPEYGVSFAEMDINNSIYQVQLTLTPIKENFIGNQKIRVRFDENDLPTLDSLIGK